MDLRSVGLNVSNLGVILDFQLLKLHKACGIQFGFQSRYGRIARQLNLDSIGKVRRVRLAAAEYLRRFGYRA